MFKIAEDMADSNIDVSNKTVHTWTGLFQERIWTWLVPKKVLNTLGTETKWEIKPLTK